MGKEIEADWSKIQLEYKTGQLSCRDLAEKFGVSRVAVEKRCFRQGWKREKDQIVQIVSEKTIQKVVDEKMEAIKAHEAKAFRVSDKLISAVELSHDSMQGQPLDPPMIQGLAMSLKTSVGVAREALGIQDVQRVDVTSAGMHVQALDILNSCRKLKEAGQLPSSSEIDVEALLLEHEKSKAEEGK